MDIKEIRELVEIVKDNQLKRIRYRKKDSEIMIENQGANIVYSTMGVNVPEGSQVAPISMPEETEEDGDDIYEITSPQVGTFYTKENPEAEEAFVGVGDMVKKGQRIGIVEAMKIFTDVCSPVEGIIQEILVEDEDVVEFGTVLMRVKLVNQ